MKEKRSLFDNIFKKKNASYINESNKQIVQLQMLNGYNATYTAIGDDIYDSKIARQCIDRIATHCAKLQIQHIQNDLSHIVNGDIHRLLNNRPNPIMSTFDFIYKTISMLYSDLNAFIYIAKDNGGYITGFYPVFATTYELKQGIDGVIYLEFRFINGQIYRLPYEEIIHLRLFYNRNDIFGTNDEILKTDLETVHTIAEGTKNAIKLSTTLRGILKYANSNIKDRDLKKNKDDFVKDYINLENESGIAALDGKADFTPIEVEPIVFDAEQLKRVNGNIFDYFGVSEKIINNSYNYQEYNAFYEGVIEPRALQMGQEFTAKIFSNKAIKEGHKIMFSTNLLMYAPLDSKVDLIKNLASFGMVKVDEVRELLGFLPVGGKEGERILQSLNSIDTAIANEYQLNSKKKKE